MEQALLPLPEIKQNEKVIKLKIEPKVKICKDCEQELTLDQFAKTQRKGKTYIDCRCNECRKLKAKEYRSNLTEEQKAKKRETARKYRANLPEEKKEQIRIRKREYTASLPEWKKEENKTRREIRRNRARRLWNQHKLKEGCFHCKGENLPMIERQFAEAYDSHHVHYGDKKLTKSGNTVDVSDMVGNGCPFEDIKKELEHCVTLCKTCHSLWHQKLLDINFAEWENYDSSKPLKF